MKAFQDATKRLSFPPLPATSATQLHLDCWSARHQAVALHDTGNLRLYSNFDRAAQVLAEATRPAPVQRLQGGEEGGYAALQVAQDERLGCFLKRRALLQAGTLGWSGQLSAADEPAVQAWALKQGEQGLRARQPELELLPQASKHRQPLKLTRKSRGMRRTAMLRG